MSYYCNCGYPVRSIWCSDDNHYEPDDVCDDCHVQREAKVKAAQDEYFIVLMDFYFPNAIDDNRPTTYREMIAYHSRQYCQWPRVVVPVPEFELPF